MHDLDPASYGSAGLHLSLWYYDAMKMTYGDFESFDLRTANNSQILGFATRDYSDRPNLYWVRVLSVTGTDPTGGSGYRATTIQRTLGWHHLEVYQYRDPADLNTDEFYVDGALALRETDMVDTTLSRVALGLGWSGNPSQTGYVDDITVQAIPEPGVASLALGAAAAALVLRRAAQRKRASAFETPYTGTAPRSSPAGSASPTPGPWGIVSAPLRMRSGGSNHWP